MRTFPAVLALALLLPVAAQAAPTHKEVAGAQARGHVGCRITENGAAASGTISVRHGGDEVTSGVCGTPVTVPAGDYDVVLGLDGAIDRPEQTQHVTVRGGATAEATADFRTAILQVNVQTADGHRAAALATISRNGERVGTLGSGVEGHLSAGTYDVVVRHLTAEQHFNGVTIAPGERRQLAATF